MAEQEKPVRRRVALKIIKLGMDTKEVIARFEQERQALAIMDHPNIARVIDAGATPLGRPYFAMELVRGVKITEYCDQASLSTVDRLKLFTAVCHAVQHAHQKGIIHRDLKPSNILVTLHDGVPVPKVIDFGVAKATQQQRLTDLTLFTQFEQMVGTPLYMSPEQAELSGLDIDTRSDIYSLGVLLYELLTGRTPFDPKDLMRKGLDEIRRVIREQEPQKPSTFISTLGLGRAHSGRAAEAGRRAKLSGLIRGDLDWIVMKALEKDRSRRYENCQRPGHGHPAPSHQRASARPSSQPALSPAPARAQKSRGLCRLLRSGGGGMTGLVASIWQAARANAALMELRASAPAFVAQARGLTAMERF
jgi:serine/threonine protein kinase